MSKPTEKRLDEMIFKLNETTPEEIADALFDAKEARETKELEDAGFTYVLSYDANTSEEDVKKLMEQVAEGME